MAAEAGAEAVERHRRGAPAGALASLSGALIGALAGERERWVLWLPVALAAGIGFYFALPVEPPAWTGPAALGVSAVAAIAARRKPALLIVLMALAAAALGVSAATLRTATVAAPVLERKLGPVPVEGRVRHLEALTDGRRVVLDRVSVAGLAAPRTPASVRLRLRGAPALHPGERVTVRAVLMPPPGPVAPGAFDFQRHLYFAGIGAVGYAVARPQVLGAADESGWTIRLAALRREVTARITARLDGPAGAVAAALMTGERGAIPPDVLAALRDAGLGHLLAISGLHIGLVAGIVFFGVRGALALVGPLAVRAPIKKWAALAALAGGFAYMAVSGATVPTQRATIMLAIVLLGVLLDRPALSMRLVAWAAAAVLLLAPESLLGAGFQMSFAAVVALVAAYEWLGPRLAGWRRDGGPWRRPALYLAGVALTTVIAGLATAPFAVHHFNRIAVYGLAANLVAVPLAALWIMPWAVAAFALMPLGLEGLALAPMGWGINALVAVARSVAGWEGAVALAPAMPVWGLVAVALGGLWLSLWRRRWRLFGVPLMAAGMATVWLTETPDVLVADDGRLIAVKDADGRLSLSSSRAGRFSAEAWLRLAGAEEPAVWPREGASADGRLTCDAMGCVLRAGAQVVALARDPRALADDCRIAGVLVSTEPVRRRCPTARLVVDRFDLWRNGSHALWLDGDGVRVESARGVRGERPWVLKPERAPRR